MLPHISQCRNGIFDEVDYRSVKSGATLVMVEVNESRSYDAQLLASSVVHKSITHGFSASDGSHPTEFLEAPIRALTVYLFHEMVSYSKFRAVVVLVRKIDFVLKHSRVCGEAVRAERFVEGSLSSDGREVSVGSVMAVVGVHDSIVH